jgi:hypothetical protein
MRANPCLFSRARSSEGNPNPLRCGGLTDGPSPLGGPPLPRGSPSATGSTGIRSTSELLPLLVVGISCGKIHREVCEMRSTALALSLLALLVAGSLRPAQAVSESQYLLGKISITQQNWRHSGKLLIVDVTFRNDNTFAVQRVVLSCQITGDPARPQDSRGVTIRQDVSVGNTVVRGIEFPITHDKAQGGPCKVESAERAP